MRAGIMGGTFNPIHFGHLCSAQEICDAFSLDTLLIVPSLIAPHKNNEQIICAKDRIAMVELAVKGNERFFVSTCEIDRKGISYSIDTVFELKKRFEESAELFFILGIDAFREISSWKSPDKLFLSINFIVHTRPGYPIDDIMKILDKNITRKYNTIRFFDKGHDPGYPDLKITNNSSDKSIYTVKITGLDISSTQIRKKVKDNQSIKYLLPSAVEEYIIKKKLYRCEVSKFLNDKY